MKTLKLLAVGIILLVSSSIQAQVSVNLNIGTAPAWGPSGYAAAEYYYLPDVQAYYDVRASLFVYFEMEDGLDQDTYQDNIETMIYTMDIK
jgi:hypothetical protein